MKIKEEKWKYENGKWEIHLYDLLDALDLDLVHKLHLCHPPDVLEYLIDLITQQI